MGMSWSSGSESLDPEEKLNRKFQPPDGVTLYSYGMSPTSRRVKITLLEKQVSFQEVEVDLLQGEQGSKAYSHLNPNMKVPALTIRNIQGHPDVTLFESNVITEFVDKVFPGHSLYPDDEWELTQCRQWQDWERGLTDDFIPVMYTNSLLAAIMKLTYSTEERFINSMMEKNASKMTMSRMVKGYRGVACGSRDQLKQHAVGILKSLLYLEEALEGKEYLVGNRLTIADISVYPRVAMATYAKINISERTFPNITCYLSHLSQRPSFYATGPTYSTIMLNYFSGWIVSLASWKTGKQMEHVELSAYYESANEEYKRMKFPATSPLSTCVIHPDAIILFHYSTSATCWQAQIILKLKEKDYRVVDCDVTETVGHPSGSGGIYRIQHGGRKVTGARAMLEYIDQVTGKENALYPDDPSEKALCQCWQAWEQTTYIEIFQFFEIEVVSAALQDRFPPGETDHLLSLRSDPNYSHRFDAIMKAYLTRLKKSHPRYEEVMNNYSHLKPSIRDQQKLKLAAIERLHERLNYLNLQLQDKKFLVGETLSMADCCIFIHIVLLSFLGLKVSDRKFPHVVRWMGVLRKMAEFRNTEEDLRHEIQRMVDECERESSEEEFDLI